MSIFEQMTGSKVNDALSGMSPMLLAMGQNMMAPPQQRDPRTMQMAMAQMQKAGQARQKQAEWDRIWNGATAETAGGFNPNAEAPRTGGLRSQVPQELHGIVEAMGPDALPMLAQVMTQPEAQGTSAMREYEFATQQGFNGSFFDFVNKRAAAGRPVTTVTNNVNSGAAGPRYLTAGDAGLPNGWRFDTTTGVAEPIPGGPAALDVEDRAQEADQGVQQAQSMLNSVEGIINDPALDTATGVLSILQNIPGTEWYRFGTRARQLEGQAFLQAFDSLKGAGQITEIEGQKATQAIGRLDTAQSAEDYREALGDLQSVLRDSIARRSNQANSLRSGGVGAPAAAPTPTPTGNFPAWMINTNPAQWTDEQFKQAQEAGFFND